MYSKITTVINETGLHARPASDFVRTAHRFSSDITIRNLTDDGQSANCKSIIEVLAEGISQNCQVMISAEGEDETLAVDTLVGMIDSGFSE